MIGAVAADLAERDLETLGADARRLREYFAEIAFAESEPAEIRQLGLLPQQPLDLPGEFNLRGGSAMQQCRMIRSATRSLWGTVAMPRRF